MIKSNELFTTMTDCLYYRGQKLDSYDQRKFCIRQHKNPDGTYQLYSTITNVYIPKHMYICILDTGLVVMTKKKFQEIFQNGDEPDSIELDMTPEDIRNGVNEVFYKQFDIVSAHCTSFSSELRSPKNFVVLTTTNGFEHRLIITEGSHLEITKSDVSDIKIRVVDEGQEIDYPIYEVSRDTQNTNKFPLAPLMSTRISSNVLLNYVVSDDNPVISPMFSKFKSSLLDCGIEVDVVDSDGSGAYVFKCRKLGSYEWTHRTDLLYGDQVRTIIDESGEDDPVLKYLVVVSGGSNTIRLL